MTYIRSRLINGYGPYDYEVRSVRKAGKPYPSQEFVRYLGLTSERDKRVTETVVANKRAEEKRGYLDVGEESERETPKTWDRQRRERAQSISRATGASAFQADALAKTAWRMGLDPEKVDWDQLQGKDLSYEDKLDKLEEMTGMSVTTDADREMEYANWQEDAAEREAFRVGVFGGEGI
jgi:hypothetical protein